MANVPTPVPQPPDRSTDTVLKAVAGLTLLGAGLALLLMLPALNQNPLRLIGPSLNIGIALLSLLLMRLGRRTLAIDVLTLGLFASVTFIAALTGGVRSSLIVVYPVLVLCYGWLRHDRAAVVMAILASVSIVALWWGYRQNLLAAHDMAPDPVRAMTLIVVCVVVAVLIHFIRRMDRTQLDQLENLGQELADYTRMLERSEARHRTLIEWTPEAILVHRDTKILYANPAALKLFGAPSLATLQSRRTSQLIHPDQLEEQTRRMQQIMQGQPHAQRVETRFVKLDGTPIDVEVQGTAIDYDDAPAIHVSIRDITVRKQLEEEIRQLAFYDPLTHLPNRRLLHDRIGQVLSANKRSGQYGALLFLDLDNFKPLNDRYGHTVGDQVLVQAAARLKACVRANDTVARYGGDEFVVLLSELDSQADTARALALQLAQKIQRVMDMPYPLHAPPGHAADPLPDYPCTVSIGVAVSAPEESDMDELIARADRAMYQAKSTGSQRIALADEPPAPA